MDSRPQLPRKAHKKEGKSISSREQGMEDFDTLGDRKIGNGSTLKFGTQMDMDKLRPDSGVYPRPSASHADPLVSCPNKKLSWMMTDENRIGQDGGKS
jgi:hypothetical protein